MDRFRDSCCAFSCVVSYTSDTYRLLAHLSVAREAMPHMWFFLNWSSIVPADIVAAFECVNFHAAPLPYGRGGAPIENMILRGHTETIITAHRMTAEIDAGPIYGTRGPISLAGTKDQILARFIEPCADLIQWIVTEEPTPAPQVGEVVHFRRLGPEAYKEFWKARA